MSSRNARAHERGVRTARLSDPNFGPSVGVEIEGWIPERLGRQTIAQAIRHDLQKQHPELKIEVTPNTSKPHTTTILATAKNLGTSSNTTKRSRHLKKRWAPNSSAPYCETSKTSTTSWLSSRALKKIGFTAEPLSSGVHVHVDFLGAELAALHQVFAQIERELSLRFMQTGTRKRTADESYPSPVGLTKQNRNDFTPEEFTQKALNAIEHSTYWLF